MKLHYSPNLNPRVAVAVAKYLNAPVEYVRADPQHPANTAAFLPLNPNALVPVLEEDDGSTLWETDAIACRLSMVTGSNFWRLDEQMPDMIRWISWSTHNLNAVGGIVYFDRLICPKYGLPRKTPESIDRAVGKFIRYAQILDHALTNRTWLVGNTISYADFRAATCLPFAEAAEISLETVPNVRRWYDQLCAIDAWIHPFEGLAV